MGDERAKERIRKYLAGTATEEEEALLEAWYIAVAQDQPALPGVPDYEKIEAEIWLPLQSKTGPPIRPLPRIAAAASILAILAFGSLFIFRKKSTQTLVEIRPPGNDILPARTKATLTLFDGQTIPLDSGSSQQLARQDNVTLRTLNGQLIYALIPSSTGIQTRTQERTQTSTRAGTMAYNTLTTRPGEHYSLVLPDGTKVWLNAASSITYPVLFNGDQRNVRATGEIYFEIAHNAKQPFLVAVKDQLVEDIGTHLNINAYDDEPVINTTLVEGSIKIMKGNASVVLNPGQQATMRPGDSAFQITQIDADESVAWKNGYFYFDRADIKTVMRELARWYAIHVVYKGDLPKGKFKGKLYRNINVSDALGILSYFGAHFQIDRKTITVSS